MYKYKYITTIITTLPEETMSKSTGDLPPHPLPQVKLPPSCIGIQPSNPPTGGCGFSDPAPLSQYVTVTSLIYDDLYDVFWRYPLTYYEDVHFS